MPSFVQIDSLHWPTTEFALASLNVRVDELAKRVAFRVDAWDEDGLGPARGAALSLSSGRPVLLQELQFPIETGASGGPDVWVDAGDLAALGVEALLAELLAALELPLEAVVWVQDDSVREQAAQRSRWTIAYRAARDRGLPPPGFPLSDSVADSPTG